MRRVLRNRVQAALAAALILVSFTAPVSTRALAGSISESCDGEGRTSEGDPETYDSETGGRRRQPTISPTGESSETTRPSLAAIILQWITSHLFGQEPR